MPWLRSDRRAPSSLFTGAALVWVATLCLLGQGAGFAHMVLVPHRRCAEHGEMEHAGKVSGDVSGDASGDALTEHALGAAPADRMPGVAADGSNEDQHGHDHCLVVTDRRKQVYAPGSSVAVPPTAMALPAHQDPIGADAGQDSYRLAPKTSPPV